MSKFGKYAIVDNVRYHLEREPELWWEFKPPTAREEVAINRFTQGQSIKQTGQGIERKIITNAEVALEELALTFADCNFVDDDEKPLFISSMNVEGVKKVIQTFPRPLFYELWQALGETCPGWGALPAKAYDPDAEADKEGPKEPASSQS